MANELLPTLTRRLSALCEKCQGLFVQPDKPFDGKFRVIHDETSYVPSTKDCLLCGILQNKGWTKPPRLCLSFEDGRVHLTAQVIEGERKRECLMMQLFPIARESNEPTVELRYFGQQSSFRFNTGLTSDSTEDATCFEKIQRWVDMCTEEHQLCRQGRGRHDRAILPTRLIDVQNPKVVITASHTFNNSKTCYATLTHRWVQPNPAKLLRSNLSQLTRMIDPSFLSPVFRDSISAARRLGLEYIWIDSLCIIQDDADDWARESSLMEQVYQNAFINLGASGAAIVQDQQSDPGASINEKSRSSLGMFLPREPSEYIAPYVNIIRMNHNQRYYGNQPGHDRVAKELIQRGWVFQERLLSPRSVYFDKLLTWECPELLANELFPYGQPLEKPDETISHQTSIRLATFLERSKSKYSTYGNGVRIDETYWTWLALVTMYKECQLTYESDIIPALSGLAKEFNKILHDDYVAGIWKSDMIRGLSWRIYRRHKPEVPKKPLEYQAPSWSWASAATAGELLGFIHVGTNEDVVGEAFLAEVHDVHLTMASLDHMGQIIDGYIKISGHLRSRQEVGPCITDDDDDEYEAYDDDRAEKGYHPDENTLYLALTLQRMASLENDQTQQIRRVRGLIVEPTGRESQEYRRLGLFSIDPDHRPAFKGVDLENDQAHVIKIV